METKQFEGHTPGPWRLNETELTGGQYRLGTVTPKITMGVEGPLYLSMRKPDLNDPDFERLAKIEIANARLLTAAPELLKERDELEKAFSVENSLHLKARDGWEQKDTECRNLKSLNAELLEALKEVQRWIETGEDSEFQETVSQAIAKAEGSATSKPDVKLLDIGVGQRVGELLDLKFDRVSGRCKTTWGNKSVEGLGKCILRIADEEAKRLSNG